MKNIYLTLSFLVMSLGLMAQGSVTGKVVDGSTEEPIIGAIVKLAGTNNAAITDLDGGFTIANVIPGDYTADISSVGYKPQSIAVSVGEGSADLGTISLGLESIAIQGVEIIADVAIDRKTPVAVSNVDGEYIAQKTGNQELTEVLTVSPSVYASRQGGGYGDSRLTVRGFDDRNVVVMINGVPVNDMENQRLFWSNWAGLTDVASKVQIQRGLGATQLAVPSIGGTLNIITKGTDVEKGGWFETTIGNDQFRKYALNLSTGEMKNGWAITAAGARTIGDGYVDGTFIDAYSWFGSVSKDWKKHSIIFAAFGAPQRHGQGQGNRLSLGQFVTPDGSDYAEFIDGMTAGDVNDRVALLDADGRANSIRYNNSWGYISREVNNGFTSASGIFNQSSNFYHKPQASLTHYWDVKDNLQLTSAVYGSVGRGGGAWEWGGLDPFDFRQGNGGPVDWDAVTAANAANNPDGVGNFSDGEPFYFFRASMNHHQYGGILSKAIVDLSDELTLSSGIDFRVYSADHISKMIDGFGINSFIDTGFADFQPNGKLVVADDRVFGRNDDNSSIYDRDNTGFVNWVGGFSELEYSNDQLTAAIGGSISNKAYKFEQRYNVAAGDPNRESDWYNFLGGNIKGGANYNINDAHNVYANAGYLSIQPIFDNVFQGGNDGKNRVGIDIFEDPANEKVLAFEAGYGLSLSNFGANLNLYRTSWQDKAFPISAPSLTDPDLFNFGNVLGIDALHQGVELDLVYQPMDQLQFRGAGSLGDWTWQNNTAYNLFDQVTNQLLLTDTLFVDGVKVGNAPQSQFSLGAEWTGNKGLGTYLNLRHFMDHYASFAPEGRTDRNLSGVNSDQLPDFGVLDAGISYDLDVSEGSALRFFGNVNNLADNLYVSQARESVGFDDASNTVEYADLSDLRGNFGLGRTWNAGARLVFKPGKKPVAAPPVPIADPEPVVLDRDGDGVIDAADDCPDTPGTVNGCPDADGDGVVDENDDCPNTPGLAANNGCPAEPEVEEKIVEVPADIPDADGDGLLDNVDNCPNEAGPASNAGCPVKVVAPAAPTTSVVDQINFIARSVLFNTNSDVIRTTSRTKLDEIAALMLQYPSTKFVVEGHTDNVGDDTYNLNLSRQRAASVVNYLVGKGVSRAMLSSVGYGETQPIATNSTPEGRQQNRRVVVRLGQ